MGAERGAAGSITGADARKGTQWVQHRLLMCQVNDLTYDFGKKAGVLHMAPGNCCHKPGCTDLFERIDPKAQRIETFAGDKADTINVRERGGDWRAMLPAAR